MARRRFSAPASRRRRLALKSDVANPRSRVTVSPLAAPNYVYKKLTATHGFRLITLLPGRPGEEIYVSLNEHDLDAEPPFVALSYMWGPAEASVFIHTDGQSLQIRRNLYDALQALRSATLPLTVWIDAICIDQTSIEERNKQVAHMWRIYSEAKAVLLWLGNTPVEHKAELSVQRANFQIDEHQNISLQVYHDIPTQSLPALEDVFQHLVGNPYWQRAWIRQEVLAAKYVIICFGSSRLNWQSFAEAAIKCRSYRLSLPGSPEDLVSTFRYHGGAKALWDIIEQRRTDYRSDDLKTLIEKYGMSACADSRDRIFALFGLANNCETISPRMRTQWHGHNPRFRADYSLSNKQVYEMVYMCGHTGAYVIDRDFDHHLKRCLDLPKSYMQPVGAYMLGIGKVQTG